MRNWTNLGRPGIAALAASALVGALIPVSVLAAVAVAAAVVLFAVTMVRPVAGVAIGIAVIALPYAWSPTVSGTTLGPALAVSTVWGIAGLLQIATNRPRLRLTSLDLAVVAFIAAPGICAIATGGSLELCAFFVANAGVPYFGLRTLLAANPELDRSITTTLLVTGLAVAVVALVEAASGINVSDPLATSELAGWNREYERAGIPRVDSTLGHPIALGAFLLVPIAICATRIDRRWLLALPVLLGAEALTVSRGPWAGLVLVAIMVAIAARSARSRWLSISAALLVIAAMLAFVPSLRELVLDSFGGDSTAGENAELRSQVIGDAFRELTLFGNPLPQGQSDELLATDGDSDVASFLAMTMLRTGLVGLVALLALGLIVARYALGAMRSRDADLQGIAVGAFSQLAVLMVVSLITSFQHFFWLGLAVMSSLWIQHRTQAHATKLTST